MNDTEWPKITEEQSKLAFEFLESLFDEDVERYWRLISKVDQARVYGMYRAYLNENDSAELSFYDYVKNYIKPDNTEVYEGLKNNHPGISTTLRYTQDGECLIYLLEDVQVQRVYIAPTEAKVYPVIMTIDADLKEGELGFSWKVRIYRDQLYKDIS